MIWSRKHKGKGERGRRLCESTSNWNKGRESLGPSKMGVKERKTQFSNDT